MYSNVACSSYKRRCAHTASGGRVPSPYLYVLNGIAIGCFLGMFRRMSLMISASTSRMMSSIMLVTRSALSIDAIGLLDPQIDPYLLANELRPEDEVLLRPPILHEQYKPWLLACPDCIEQRLADPFTPLRCPVDLPGMRLRQKIDAALIRENRVDGNRVVFWSETLARLALGLGC